MNIDTGKYIIAAIGIAMLAVALYWVQSTRHYLAQSSTAQGTVVALLPEGRDIARAPVVRFVTANGDNIEFTSDTRSNPPGYTQGQHGLENGGQGGVESCNVFTAREGRLQSFFEDAARGEVLSAHLRARSRPPGARCALA